MTDLHRGLAAALDRVSSFTCHHADRPEPGGAAGAASQQGRGMRKLAWPVARGGFITVVAVLSLLTGLQGRLDLRFVSVPARVQRPLVMG